VPRAERFGDLVVAAVDRLEPRWGRHLSALDVEVHDVPPAAAPVLDAEVPLAAHRPGGGGRPPAVIVYRRPVELRAPDRPTRIELLRDLVAEQLAEILGVAPGEIDPGYDPPR
jgi:hypothetical protein